MNSTSGLSLLSNSVVLVDGVLGLVAVLGQFTLEYSSSCISLVSIPVGKVVVAGEPPHIS